MNTIEAILTRRSIRKFTPESVSEEDLHQLLECAMNAPSACNEQPWHFVVARDSEVKERISKTSPYTGMAAAAPVVIVVCGDLSLEKAKGFWVQDCSVAIENLMLAARDLNLGCVWCGIHPVQDREEYLKKELGLPENVIPLGLVCLGHPAQKFQEADRFREDRIHMEKW